LRLVNVGDGAVMVRADLPQTESTQSYDSPSVVAFSPNGRRVFSGGRLLEPARLERPVSRMSDGSPMRYALSCADGTVRMLEGCHTDAVTAVAFSPDGKTVLSGGADDTLCLWNIEKDTLIRAFKGHSDKVTSVAFSPDGGRVLSGSADIVRLWDVSSGNLVHALKGHTGPVLSVAFSQDGRRILSAGDYTWCLWDAASFAPIMTAWVLPKRDWLVELSDGRYRATDGASRRLAAIDGVKVLSMEQYEKDVPDRRSGRSWGTMTSRSKTGRDMACQVGLGQKR
jgi:WD40 repeat protein